MCHWELISRETKIIEFAVKYERNDWAFIRRLWSDNVARSTKNPTLYIIFHIFNHFIHWIPFRRYFFIVPISKFLALIFFIIHLVANPNLMLRHTFFESIQINSLKNQILINFRILLFFFVRFGISVVFSPYFQMVSALI